MIELKDEIVYNNLRNKLNLKGTAMKIIPQVF